MKNNESTHQMNDKNGIIFDVTTEEYEEKVLAVSEEKTVVVDFWAEWCAPCRMLGPILEKVVRTFNGSVLLAKVNVDENQELAMLNGVQSIPAVKIFRNGVIAEEFVGALPEHEVVKLITSAAGDENSSVLVQANSLLDSAQNDEAEPLFQSILEKDPQNTDACIGLAKIAMNRNAIEKAKNILAAIDEGDDRYREAEALRNIMDCFQVCIDSGGFDTSKEHVVELNDDLRYQYELACCHITRREYRSALEILYAVIAKNRNYEDGKVKVIMLSLFEIIGQSNELTREYREKLARVLF